MNYPFPYPVNIRCEWNIIGDPEEDIRVSWAVNSSMLLSSQTKNFKRIVLQLSYLILSLNE